MEQTTPFKDEATQAADIIFDKFKNLINAPNATMRWIDQEFGMADINSGLLVMSYADIVIAVRQKIPLDELLDWLNYNTRLCNVQLDRYVIELSDWMSYDTKKIDNIRLEKLEETYAAMNAAAKQYNDIVGEIEKLLSTHNS